MPAIQKSHLIAFSLILILFASGYTIFSIYQKSRDHSVSALPETKSDRKNRRSDHGRIRSQSHAGTNADGALDRSQDAAPGKNEGSLDLNQARKLLDKYKSETKDLISQAEYASELVTKLCQSGHTSDAWEFIEANPGQMRNMQLREFFKNADMDKQKLVAMLSGFEFSHDVKRGLEGYLLRLNPSEYVTELSSPEIKKLQESLGRSPSDALRNALDSKLADLFGRKDYRENPPSDSVIRDLVHSFVEIHSKGLLEKRVIQQLVTTSFLNGFDKWEILKDDMDAPGVRKQLIGSMLLSNPERAIDEILVATGAGKAENVDIAVNEWIGVDSRGAVNWFSKNRGNLDQSQQNLMSSAFSKTAMACSEFDSARQWAGQIQDSQLREERLKAIAEKEAEASRK